MIKVETPTTELFMEDVIDRQPCKRHDADKGLPCWHLPDSTGFGLGAICNWRAKKAGFNNKIDERSLRLNRRPKPSKNGPKKNFKN